MRLEDALLMMELELSGATGSAALCEQAIAGGVDAVCVRGEGGGEADPGRLTELVAVCRAEDALLFVVDNAALAASAGADGVQLGSSETSVGLARATVGMERLVGAGTRSLDELTMAIELDVDYVVHYAGAGCPADFTALRGTAVGPLFAAALPTLAAAEAVVEQGIYRLCVEATAFGSDQVSERAAEFSRLLGRCI